MNRYELEELATNISASLHYGNCVYEQDAYESILESINKLETGVIRLYHENLRELEKEDL